MSDDLLCVDISIGSVGRVWTSNYRIDNSNIRVQNMDTGHDERVPENRLRIMNILINELMSVLTPEIEKLQAEINAKNMIDWV